MTPWPSPPRVLVWGAGAMLVLGAVVMVWGAMTIGVTVDETFHVVRLQNLFDHGWYLLADDLRGGEPGHWVTDRFSYAPVTTILLHLVNVACGNESWGVVEVTSAAYRVRHLGIALIGLLGTVATVGVGRLLSGRWTWGLVSGAVLVALPMWPGHSMFNVKDVPVATGYTVVTLACLLLLHLQGGARLARGSSLVLLLVGAVLMVGTRPAMWVGLALAVAVTVAVPGAVATTSRRRRVVETSAVGVLALGVLALVYPAVFSEPWTWLQGALRDPGNTPMARSAGALPFAVATTMPLLLLLVGGAGCLVRLLGWIKADRRLSASVVRMAVVALQAAAIPTAMVLTSAAASGGLRHVLFSLPATAVLLTAGAAQVLQDLQGRWARVSGSLVVLGSLLLPAVAQVQLFPYGYGHANELAVRAQLAAPDFWQASFAEYADLLADDDFVVCGFEVDSTGAATRAMPNGGQSFLSLGDNCGQDRLSVLAPLRPDAEARQVQPTFIALDVRGEDPRDCELVGEVSRGRVLARQVLSRAYRCPLTLPPLSGRVGFDGRGVGHEYLLGGWTGTTGDDFIAVQDRASLGYRSSHPVRDVRVVIDGLGPAPEEVLVNNVPAEVRAVGSSWHVTLPDAPVLGSDRNVVLTLVAGDEEVRVVGLSSSARR